MSTHDYVLSNQSGSSFRTDLNNALAAIVSGNSSGTEPSTTYAYMTWVDTSSNLVKLRNSANNGWVSLFTTAGGINVDAASTFNEDVTFDGATAGRDVVWDRSANQLLFADSTKAMFGAGSDLEIYSTGTNGWVFTPQSGADLYMGANAGEVYIQTGTNGNDSGLIVRSGGTVELYYNNVITCKTDPNGIRVQGPDGGLGQIELFADRGDDNGDKWRIQARTDGNMNIQNYGGGSWVNSLQLLGGDACKLFYDNNLKFSTSSTGNISDGILELQDSASTRGKISAKSITNVSTTWTDIVSSGIGGVAMITAYNTTGGNQLAALVMWRVNSHTVISESDNTGLGVDYRANGATLQIKTTSGTITGGATCLTV